MTTGSERVVLGLLWCVVGLVFLMLYAPPLLIVFQSFFDATAQRIDLSSFGFQWYRSLADNQDILESLRNSLLVACGAVLLSTALALAIAYYMKTGIRRGKRLVELFIVLPFVLPPIITGISLLIGLTAVGISNGLIAVTIGHAILVLAVLYRMISVRLASIEASQIEASLDLGAGHFRTFWYVILPQLRPALVTGGLLAFAISFDETLVSFFLVGSDVTLPIRLWGMLRIGFSPEVNAFAALILLTTGMMVVLGALLMRRSDPR